MRKTTDAGTGAGSQDMGGAPGRAGSRSERHQEPVEGRRVEDLEGDLQRPLPDQASDGPERAAAESGTSLVPRPSPGPPPVSPVVGTGPEVPGDAGGTGGGPGAGRYAGGVLRHPLLRFGAYAWALLGLAAAAVLAGLAAIELRVVVVPLLIALFPAALLMPLVKLLKRRGVPPAAAAVTVEVAMLLVFAGVVWLIAPRVADELGGVGESLREGYQDVREFLDDAVGFDPGPPEELADRAREVLGRGGGAGVDSALRYGSSVLEVLSGMVLTLVALFFYLKDGGRIGRALQRLFPARLRPHVEAMGGRVWGSIGAFFRGQLFIAFVDAFFIGLGLVLLGVPLALPLAVFVFIGGLFPIVGAFVAGMLAVLVALADSGLGTAFVVVVLIVAVQQLEGNLLEPVVVGRATHLNPFLVILAVAAGAVVLGVLGAFLAVPLVAAAARVVEYARETEGFPPDHA